MGTIGEKLPDGWIRKESKSRANRVYYYNIKTGQSQWESPVGKDTKAKTRDERSKSAKTDSVRSKDHSTVSNRLKISDKSKDVKRNKTPAQDRLQNVAKKKVIAESVKDLVGKITTTTNSNNKQPKTSTVINSAKKPLPVTKCSGDTVDSAKTAKPVENNCSSEVSSPLRTRQQTAIKITIPSPDKIPSLFPSKTRAQDRISILQHSASAEPSNKDPFAIDVFQSGFGMSGNNDETGTAKMDEEMEWEDCGEYVDDSTYSFQQLEDMVVDVMSDPNESAYIIPDTNVFLDSLAPIKRVMEKDHKYSILVPFVVLQELDSLKSRRDQGVLNAKASRAIRYIYEELKAKNQRMQGQKATEDNAPIINVKCADDKILNCCLQLKTKSSDVILLTNDINLSNKALMNDIEAITSKQFLEKF